MAVTAAQIQQAYVAFFNRPADPLGLQFWLNRATSANQTLAQITQAFGNSAEYTALYAGQTEAQRVNAVYQNLFGRNAETGGLNFWATELIAGRRSIADIALIISQNAQGTDATVISNRVSVATAFTNGLDTADKILAYSGSTAAATARTFLATVTADAATVTTATGNVGSTITNIVTNVGTGTAGQTFTLTTGVDSLTGTTANDTFTSVIANGAGNGQTLNSGDTINGGTGTDTLNVTLTTADTPTATLSSVETVSFTPTVDSGTISAASWTGVTEVRVTNPTKVGNNNLAGVTLGDLQGNTALTVSNVTSGFGAGARAADDAADTDTTATVLLATFAGNKVGSSSANLAINVNSVGVASSAANAFEDRATISVNASGSDKFTSLTVTGTGTNLINLEQAAGFKLDTLTFKGTGSIDLTTGSRIGGVPTDNANKSAAGNGNFNDVKTVNASENTGGVSVNISASTVADQTITGGTGNDTFTVDLQRNITLNAGAGNDTVRLTNATADNLSSATGSADSITGGDGTDTLRVTAANAAAIAGDTAADRAVISGFEILRIDGALDGTAIDVSKISGGTINRVRVTDAAGADTNVTGLTSGATIDYRHTANAGSAVNVGITGATDNNTPNDTLNVLLNANIAANAAALVRTGIAGINIVNVTASDSDNADSATTRTDGYQLVLSNDASLATLNLAGAALVRYVASSTATALGTISGGTATGNQAINLNSFAGAQGVAITAGGGDNQIYATGQADSITGGARADTVTAGAGNDTVTGGAGNDFLDGGTGADTLTGGDGTDAFGVNATNSSSVDSITDINFSSEKIIVTTAPTTINNSTANVDAQATLLAAAGAVSSSVGANGAGTFTYKGDTYLLIDQDASGTFTSATDIIVKVNGSTGTLATSSFTTTGLTFTGTNAPTETLNGTAGNDTFSYAAGATGLTSTKTIDGGAGSDTVALTGNTAVSATDFDSVSNIETITVANTTTNIAITTKDALVASGATLTLNASGLTSGTLTFNGAAETNGKFSITGGAAADTITGGSGDDTFTFIAGTGLTAADTVNGGAGNDTVALTGNTAVTAALFDGVSNIETITVANTTTNIAITTVDNLVASGATLTLSASSLTTGVLTFTGTAETNGKFNITGGAAGDTIVGGQGADTISGGEGADNITGGQGADTINLTETTAAIDTVIYTNKNEFGATETINNFAAGAGVDVIQFAAAMLVNGTPAATLNSKTAANWNATNTTVGADDVFVAITDAQTTSAVSTAAGVAGLLTGVQNNIANGDKIAIVLRDATDQYVWYWEASATNATAIDTAELTLVGKLAGISGTAIANGDFTFV